MFCPKATAAVTMGAGGIWREDSKGSARIILGSWASQSSSKNKVGGVGEGDDFPVATYISLEIFSHFTILKELQDITDLFGGV